MDAVRAARYPFLASASRYVAEHGPALEDLLTDRVYQAARARGRDRAVAAVRDGALPRTPLVESIPARDLLEELLAYGYARILVSATGDKYVARRHAVAESKRVTALLDDDAPDALVAAAAEFGMEAASADDGRYRLHFTHFLRYATHVKDTAYKLANQRLRKGRVEVTHHVLARLVEEALRRRIEGELPKPVPPDVKKAVAPDLTAVEEAARERKSEMEAGAFGEVDLTLMPPCMKHILAQLQAGENAAHTARFAITSFLNTIGMDTEAIMKLFSTAPDFREDLTRYQVEHITGKTSGTEYSPPGCQTMKTYGICYNEDEWCRRTNPEGERYVAHPLSYYRWAQKRKAWAKRQGAPAESAPAKKAD